MGNAVKRCVSERGVVSSEFLIAIFPMLTLVLGIMQIAQAVTAGVVTQHAAYMAARAAATVLPEGDKPDLVPDDRLGALGGYGDAHDGCYGGSRYEDVHQAAAFVTAAVSPRTLSVGGGDRQSITRALLDTATGYSENAVTLFEHTSDKNEYALAATHVELLDEGGDRCDFEGGGQEVHTKVTYLFRCNIPLVNKIICKSYSEVQGTMTGNPHATNLGGGKYLAIVREAQMPYQRRIEF